MNSQDRTAELISLEARFASAVLPYPCCTPPGDMEIPDETDRLRQQAQRALRLARGITDDRAAQALKASTSPIDGLTSKKQIEAH